MRQFFTVQVKCPSVQRVLLKHKLNLTNYSSTHIYIYCADISRYLE